MKKYAGMCVFSIIATIIFFVTGNTFRHFFTERWEFSNFLLMVGCYVLSGIFALVFIVYLVMAISSRSKRANETAALPKTYSYTPPISSSSRFDVVIPDRIDQYYKIYDYSKIPFSPSEKARVCAANMRAANNWSLTIVVESEHINLYFNNDFFGELLDKKQMVMGWYQKPDKMIKVWLGNIGDSGNYVRLVFYRDEESYLAGRETTVVKLTNCLNQDAQDSMIGLSDGDKLDFDTEYDFEAPDDTVWVTSGSAIGRLPKRIAKRYLDEGAKAIFLDHLDYDYEKEKDIPYVKIYW